MKKWEYRVITVDFDASIEVSMNTWGGRGWEVIDIHRTNSEDAELDYTQITLKREVLENRFPRFDDMT